MRAGPHRAWHVDTSAAYSAVRDVSASPGRRLHMSAVQTTVAHAHAMQLRMPPLLRLQLQLRGQLPRRCLRMGTTLTNVEHVHAMQLCMPLQLQLQLQLQLPRQRLRMSTTPTTVARVRGLQLRLRLRLQLESQLRLQLLSPLRQQTNPIHSHPHTGSTMHALAHSVSAEAWQ